MLSKNKTPNKNECKGIGGWLILLTLRIGIFVISYSFLTYTFLSYLLDPESEFGLSLRLFLMCGIMVFINTYTIILEFQHKKKFINWAIVALWIHMPMLIYLDLALGFELGFESTLKQILANYAIVIAQIIAFTLYLKKSKRVKNTFIRE